MRGAPKAEYAIASVKPKSRVKQVILVFVGPNDSRSWGSVPKSLIYGKFMSRYWPLKAVD